MYNLVACKNCRYAEEIQIIHFDGTTYIYICHNDKSKEFGLVHAEFYECRLEVNDMVKCDDQNVL